MISQYIKKLNKKKRVQSKLSKDRPRLSIFCSGKHIYAQVIDRKVNKTISAASEKEILSSSAENKITKTERANMVGEIIARKTIKAGVKKVVFDRNCFRYHGRVKALAEGARKAGLDF